jgi:hypothetical protein
MLGLHYLTLKVVQRHAEVVKTDVLNLGRRLITPVEGQHSRATVRNRVHKSALTAIYCIVCCRAVATDEGQGEAVAQPVPGRHPER